MTQSSEQRNGNTAKSAKKEKGRLHDKTVTITMSLPKAVFGALFSVFALVWVFIFGIMIGRGHNPEEIVPELAKVMPAPADSRPSPVPVEEVLQPRDLKYHDSLKGKNAAQPPRAAAPPSAPQPAAKPVAEPAPVPPQSSEPAKPAQTKPQTAVAPDPDRTVYTYVYQVAAFTNQQQAQTMQQKLRDSGIQATVSKALANKTTWFRVLVHFKGSPADTRALREKLAAQGIANVLLRSKSPVK